MDARTAKCVTFLWGDFWGPQIGVPGRVEMILILMVWWVGVLKIAGPCLEESGLHGEKI